jgi:diketogulonate reductase-like aldo/keto reductase
MSNVSPMLLMNNKLSIPQMGFGVFLIKDINEAEKCCLEAFKLGYRHIDTAHIYGNEKGVGAAIKKSGLKREEIFLTSKIWHNECGEGITSKAIEKMLKRLDVSYLDLLLIHWPVGDYCGAWKDMEKAVNEGKVKSIGLSNFKGKYLEDILKIAKIMPVVDQVECHPYDPCDDLRKELNKLNCYIEAWSPIGRGNQDLFKEQVLIDLGKKYKKSVAQIILRWHIEKGNIIFPKSSNPIHIKENWEIFDFKLTKEEVEKIDGLKKQPIFTANFEEKLKNIAAVKVSLED